MNTFNRVVLGIIFLIAFLVATVAALIVSGALSVGQLQSVIPYQQVVSLITANIVASIIIGIVLLIVLMALGFLWLRGELSGTVRAVTGGSYETAATGPGSTVINYDVVVEAINTAIRSTPGVIDSQTRIYSEKDGYLFANSNITVQRSADIHAIDNSIRDRINSEWLQKLGSDLAQHDIVINLEPQERRVA